MLKFNKVIITVALVFLLLIILVLGYLFIRSNFQTSNNIIGQKDPIKKEEILNLDKKKSIKNPSEEDVLKLINDLKDQNKELEIE